MRVEFLKGNDTPVCRDYTNWLASRQPANSPFSPIAGKRRFGFEQEWTLLRNVEEFIWARDVNPANHFRIDQASQWTGTPEQRATARANFHQSFTNDIEATGYQVDHIDIDNDGIPDEVFSLVRQIGSTVLVLNAAASDVDRARTEQVLAHPNRVAAGWPDVRPPWPGEPTQFAVLPVTDAYVGADYLSFVYRGSTYIRFWWTIHPDHPTREWVQTGTEHIFRIDGSGKVEVCEYRVVL
jgi:hypothetical protein